MFIRVITLCMIYLFPVLSNAGLSNQLKDHASPYLAMHANDPVAWQAWGPAVLAQAKQQNKLIFVSIGYFACHWCHVMQRESYADETVAKHLNAHFIPVKVDRELDAALDAYLIDFVQQTRGQAGWPLNVFVTPEGNPVVGITYLPKPQFIQLLTKMDQLWATDNKYMSDMAAKAAALQKNDKFLTPQALDNALGEQLLKLFSQQALSYGDELAGGFGEQTKFPMISQLNTLLTAYELHADVMIKSFVELTLNQMATQGLRDHVGGGFYRYTVDPNWQTPHYEKMLYTNAELAILYLRAAALFKRPDYRSVALETLDFMIRELTTQEGAMVASLSAVDNQGVEGGYYLWDKIEVKKLVTAAEFAVLNLLWQMENTPAQASGYLPRSVMTPDDVAKRLGVSVDEVMAHITSAYQKLYQERKSRSIPVDTKQLAGWNGLALAAFAFGARQENGKKYAIAAAKIRDYLCQQLWDGKRLYRARGKDGPIGEASLEDYAYAAHGLLQWSTLNKNALDLKIVRQWLDIAWRRFYGPTGWQLSDEMLLPYKMGVAVIEDNPMPSPSTMLIRTTLLLAQQAHDEVLLSRVSTALQIGHDLLARQAFSYASQIELIHQYQFQAKTNKANTSR